MFQASPSHASLLDQSWSNISGFAISCSQPLHPRSLQYYFGHCNTILVITIQFWSLPYNFGHCNTASVIAIQFWSLQYNFGHCNTTLPKNDINGVLGSSLIIPICQIMISTVPHKMSKWCAWLIPDHTHLPDHQLCPTKWVSGVLGSSLITHTTY